jgi:hypothetical protein
MSTRAEFRLRAHKTRTLRNEISAYRSIARPQLPIRFKNTLRQPCYPCATSGAADGGPSQRWGSPSLVSGLRPCSYKRRRSPTRGNTTRSTS